MRTSAEDRTCDWFIRTLSSKLCRERKALRQFALDYFSHYLSAGFSRFHEEMMVDLERIVDERDQRLGEIAPRGNAKSTIASLIYVLWCICEGLEHYILLGSDTTSQAEQLLKHVRTELESNEKLARDYPDACGKGDDTWSNSAIITRNNVRVDALGAGKKVRGRRHANHRITLAIIDDPENDESAASPTQRAKTWSWFFAAVMKAGEPGTNFVVVGTVINGECMVAKLPDVPGWKCRHYQSIMQWPHRMDLWNEWSTLFYDDEDQADAFYLVNKEDMDEGAEVLWEQYEPLYRLMKLWAEDQTAFMAEKQNSPINPTQCRFREEWFDEFIWGFDPPSNAYAFAAVDPSIGNDAKKGDYVGIVWGWFLPGSKKVHIDCMLRRMHYTIAMKALVELHIKHKFQMIGFETDGFQKILCDSFYAALRERGQSVPILELRHNTPKAARIERVGEYLNRRQLTFNKNNKDTSELIKQLRFFPIHSHDDGPDALEQLLTTMETWTARYLDAA